MKKFILVTGGARSGSPVIPSNSGKNWARACLLLHDGRAGIPRYEGPNQRKHLTLPGKGWKTFEARFRRSEVLEKRG